MRRAKESSRRLDSRNWMLNNGMRTDEVRDILETIATALETVKAEYSQDLSRGVTDLLKNPDVVQVLVMILGDSGHKTIGNLLKVVSGLDKVFLSDECDKIVAFCRKLQNRPAIIRFIAWNLG